MLKIHERRMLQEEDEIDSSAADDETTKAAEYIRKGYVVLDSDESWASQSVAVFDAICNAQLFEKEWLMGFEEERLKNQLFKGPDGVLDEKRFVVH